MLVVMCKAGGQRYAVPTGAVHEVVPCVRLHRADGMPPWLAGILDYRRRPTPVLDLAALATSSATPPLWSSRILILTAPQTGRVFGLMVEHVTTAELDLDPAAQTAAGAEMAALGPVQFDDAGLVQVIEPERLLAGRREILFGNTGPDA